MKFIDNIRFDYNKRIIVINDFNVYSINSFNSFTKISDSHWYLLLFNNGDAYKVFKDRARIRLCIELMLKKEYENERI